jgi:lambda repressor-like predicted transcriptional regulator
MQIVSTKNVPTVADRTERANLVRALLLSKGIRLVDIARRLGVSVPTVSKVVAFKARTRRVEEAVSEDLGLVREDFWPSRERKA